MATPMPAARRRFKSCWRRARQWQWGNGMETQPKVVKTVAELKELIGQEIGVGQWHTVTQDQVNAFADVTGDHQYIHVDPERVAKTMFGGPIAHGYLTLSMLPLL